MKQKYAFTTTAMAAALEETPISYEDLAEIERDFEDAETEIIKTQAKLMAPLYANRQKTISQIPNFWPLVIEQAPPDIDQYIDPSDSALLLSSLTSLSVSRFEIESPNGREFTENSGGDPRSVAIRFEFSENEYFEDTVLEKKFWFRKAKNGWAGLVSEPVPIKWKQGKDRTEGLLDMVVQTWEVEKPRTPQQTQGSQISDSQIMECLIRASRNKLKKKMESTSISGLSFFAWFGFIGRKVSAEESKEAWIKDEEKRKARKAAKNGTETDTDIDTPTTPKDDEEENEEDNMDLEIFPDGDELAIAISEDLWPNAIKYFTQAQEQDALSDADFESDEEFDDEKFVKTELDSDDEEVREEDGDDARPAKKRRN